MQKLALRMSCVTWNTKYEELLTVLGLPMLKPRRDFVIVQAHSPTFLKVVT